MLLADPGTPRPCRNNDLSIVSGDTHHQLPNGDYQWTSRLGHTYTTSGLPP